MLCMSTFRTKLFLEERENCKLYHFFRVSKLGNCSGLHTIVSNVEPIKISFSPFLVYSAAATLTKNTFTALEGFLKVDNLYHLLRGACTEVHAYVQRQANYRQL